MNTNTLVQRVLELRNAQRDYMTLRGHSGHSEAKERAGQRVAEAARLVDEALEQLADEPRQHVYAAIDTERDYQDRETDKLSRPDMVQLSAGDTLLAMEHNLGKARDAWYTDSDPYESTMHFVRKVCGLAVQLGERVGMPMRDA